MKTRYFWLPFCLGFLLAAFSAYKIVQPFINPKITVDVFKPAYQTLTSQPYEITKKADKIRLISYWATWCKPCVAEFKDFQKLKEKYGNKIEIIAISDESVSVIEKFKERHQYNFQFVRSSQKLPDLGLNIIPVNIVLDTNGNVLISEIGQLHTGKIEEILKEN